MDTGCVVGLFVALSATALDSTNECVQIEQYKKTIFIRTTYGYPGGNRCIQYGEK